MLADKLLAAGNSKLATYLGEYDFTGSSATVTATAFSIGAAADDRVIVVAVGGCSSLARQISGVTIGGSAATLATRSASIVRCTGIYYLAVPSGTTANIVATFSGAVTLANIGVYSLTGWPSVTLYDSTTAVDTGGAYTVTATGLDTANDGALIQVVAGNANGSLSPYTQTHSINNSVDFVVGGVKFPSVAATNTSVSHTFSGNTDKSICVAAFS